MYSTGCPSSSGSCSVLVPWSGGVSWVLLRPTSEIFVIPPRAPEDAVHSDHPNRGYSLFLLLVHPQPRPVHCRWLVPLCGMGFRCRKDLCHPTPAPRGCSSLRSSEQGLLFVPFARTSTTQARALSVVGPSVWNGLPLSQRLLPRILSDTFYSSLKTLLFSRARVGSAAE